MSCRSWWRSCTPRWPRWKRRYTTGRSRSANRTLRSVCSSSVLVKLIRRYCRVVLKNIPGHTCFQSLRSPAHKPEHGIRRGNEDSRGNEKRRSRKRYIFREKKIDKHSFFYMKFKMMDLWMQIEGTKLIFIMDFSVLHFFKYASRMPQIAQILVSNFNIFPGRGGGGPWPRIPP